MNPDGTVKFHYLLAGGIVLGIVLTAYLNHASAFSPQAVAEAHALAEAQVASSVPVLRFPTNILAPEGWEVRYLQVAPHACSYLLAKPGVGAAVWVVPCE